MKIGVTKILCDARRELILVPEIMNPSVLLLLELFSLALQADNLAVKLADLTGEVFPLIKEFLLALSFCLAVSKFLFKRARKFFLLFR